MTQTQTPEEMLAALEMADEDRFMFDHPVTDGEDFDGPDEPYFSESDLDYFADVAEDRETRWREGY